MVRMYRSRSMSAAENWRYPERDLAGSISPSASRKRILDVLMSGNSGRSWASTSPMPNWPRADSGSVMMCLCFARLRPARSLMRSPGRPCRGGRRTGPGSGPRSWLVRNSSRNLPICTSSPPASSASSIRSRFT